MNRRSWVAMAAAGVLFLAADVASAGSPSTQFVRIKNLGAAPLAVYAANGVPTEAQAMGGARLIAANGVAQFTIRQGAATALAANPDAPVTMNGAKKSMPTVAVLPFTFPRSRYVYLVAQLGAAGPMINFAQPGYRF